MKIAIIGKSGQLANELVDLKQSNASVKLFGRGNIDILSSENINAVLGEYRPDAIINASAYTAVDKAESEIEQAFLINSNAVENLAMFCKTAGCHFVHVSTDYVFDGCKGAPYLTSDPYKPQGVYGASKAEGEAAVVETLKLNGSFCIIRTSWVYSMYGNNFVKTMLKLMAEKEQLNIIDDQIGSPTWAKGLAQASLLAAINRIKGIHHWSDLGVASWYDFALAIQELGLELGMLDREIPIKPIPTSEYPTPAIRPLYSVLDKVSLNQDFEELEKYHWRKQLMQMLMALKSIRSV